MATDTMLANDCKNYLLFVVLYIPWNVQILYDFQVCRFNLSRAVFEHVSNHHIKQSTVHI